MLTYNITVCPLAWISRPMSRLPAALLLAILWLAPRTVIGELLVFTGVPPMKTLIEQIGGDAVDVQALVAPGYNPHSHEPTPRQVTALAQADLYIGVQLPFEQAWLPRIRTANPDLKVLHATDVLTAGPFSGHCPHTHDSETGSGATASGDCDPHVWTSPRLARSMIGPIRDALIALDPHHAATYHDNHDLFARQLDALDAELETLLEPYRGRRFLVLHPGWGHFAAAYGLVQVAIEQDGKEPGARSLAELVDQARRDRLRVIFVQPQFDRRLASRLADSVGAELLPADPLAPDYMVNLRRVAAQLAGSFVP